MYLPSGALRFSSLDLKVPISSYLVRDIDMKCHGDTLTGLALITLLMGNTFYARNIIASVFVMVWAARLGGERFCRRFDSHSAMTLNPLSVGFLLFRVLKVGKDTRFDDIRSRFLSFLGIIHRPYPVGGSYSLVHRILDR